MSDLDSPWKEALDQFLEAATALFFPQVHAGIDWGHGYEALDKELQQVVREAELKRRVADKLFKVWRKNGDEAWVLIHIEVQSQPEPGFAERMYSYNSRLYDRYARQVASLAVLGDDQLTWRPDRFGYSFWGCKVELQFPIAKLLDYQADLGRLESDPNPFAALVLAHLQTLATRHDAEARRGWKVRLIKGLYERGLDRGAIGRLFRLIDWMMDLPAELEEQVWHELAQFEQEKQMTYVTTVERRALQKGEAKGKSESVLRALELRFAAKAPAELEAAVRGTSDLGQLDAWFEAVFRAGSLEEFLRLTGIGAKA